jgi:hypothetical protein
VARPLYRAKRYIQADIQVYADDGFMERIMRGKIKSFPSIKYWKIVERYIKKAMLIVVNKTKSNIHMMNAVATGFMRNNIVSVVNVKGGKTPITAVIGTRAWYDILVHEGLGRHSPSGRIPSKYKPTEAQKAIIPHSLEEVKKAGLWKSSPKVPRPFLRLAVEQTKTAVHEMIKQGIRAANKAEGAKRGTPRNVTKFVLGSAR